MIVQQFLKTQLNTRLIDHAKSLIGFRCNIKGEVNVRRVMRVAAPLRTEQIKRGNTLRPQFRARFGNHSSDFGNAHILDIAPSNFKITSNRQI